jgi:hypothetical protein
MTRGNLDESYFIDPLGRDLDPERDRTVPEGASLYLRGWAYFTEPDRAAAGVVAWIDDGARFDLAYNQDRPDVAHVLGLTRLQTVGFHGMWSLAGVARGSHALRLAAIDPVTGVEERIGDDVVFEIVAGSYAFAPQIKRDGTMTMTFDYLQDALAADRDPGPPPLRIARGGIALAHGWAIDVANRAAASDVFACIDDTTFVRGIVGWKREDAAKSVGIAEAWRCGYVVRIPTNDLEAGSHRVEIRAVCADGIAYETTDPLPLEIV